MKLKEVIEILENLTPTAYAEDFDNVGLLVGDTNQTIKGIMVCHDAIEEVVDEAVENNCNLIVCFHPIIFSGMKKITGKSYVERSVIKAIKNDIAIYAIHTALDNHPLGVNKILCEAIGVKAPRILIPKKDYIYKLTTYVPVNDAQKLKDALFRAGAGNIGNYDNCSFSSNGIGSFRGKENSNPTIGNKEEFTEVEETQISVVF